MLDACATLHAKQLRSASGVDPIEVLNRLATAMRVRFATTTGVENEQVAMSLSSSIGAWKAVQAFGVEPVSVNERRAVRNRLTKGMKTPGDRDIGLVALAARKNAVLLTHDDAAGVLARKCQVISVDLLDLADIIVSRQVAAWPDVEQGHQKLATFAWKPDDWVGTVEATVMSRPSRQKLHNLLAAWP